MSVSGRNLWNSCILSFTTTLLIPYELQERFETSLPTPSPFPLMHIEFSYCTNTRVCFLCGLFESSEQYDPFFAVQGCTNDPLFYFDRTSAWQHRGGYLRFQRAKILKVFSQAELRSDSDLTQLSVFSLKPYPSANLHLIVVAYFGGPCYFVVTGDTAAFTWPQYNFFGELTRMKAEEESESTNDSLFFPHL